MLTLYIYPWLRDYAEANNLLPEEQIGVRQGRLVETALEMITNTVYTVQGIGKRNIVSLLSLDIAGAFNHVSYSRLLHTIKIKRVLERIIRQTASFLIERATLITLGRRTSQIELVEIGIPQGSPISLILFLFFNTPLIKEYKKLKLLI